MRNAILGNDLKDVRANCFCASLLRIISRVISARIKKMAAFSWRLNLAMEGNRHFLENEYGDLLFFFCCFELSNRFLYVK